MQRRRSPHSFLLRTTAASELFVDGGPMAYSRLLWDPRRAGLLLMIPLAGYDGGGKG
jgi:hypothetical protein